MSQRAASPALTPLAGNPRFELLDAVRGFWALFVVLAHVYNPPGARPSHHGFVENFTGGFRVAVEVFFALSGFVLFRPFLRAIAAGEGLPSVRTYLRRRAFRVLPAYWVALTLCGWWFAEGAPGVYTDRWWVFYFFGQSFSTVDNFRGISVAWSLSVEVGFYITLPLMVWIIARLARRVGWEAAAWAMIAFLTVMGITLRVLNSFEFDTRSVTVFFQKTVHAFQGEANYFAIGMAFAVLSVRGTVPRLASRPTLCWALGLGVYCLDVAFVGFTNPYGGLDFQTRFIANDIVDMVVVVLFLLPAFFDVRPGLPRAVLSWPPLVALGVVSFAAYLWHVPIATWLLDHVLTDVTQWDYVPRLVTTYVVVLIPTVLIAIVSYRVVELPFLRRK